MAGSIIIDNQNGRADHHFNTAKVGHGKEHENIRVAGERETSMVVQIAAFTVDVERSLLPPGEELRKPELYPRDHNIENGVKCLVDTGATTSLFRSEIADELGFKPDDCVVGDANDEKIQMVVYEFPYLRCRRKLYLEIGPHPISVFVEFPVQRISTQKGIRYEWVPNVPDENILGMQDILNKRMLCFTPDHLFAFENSR